MKVKRFNEEVQLPTKSHEQDGGLDLYICGDFEIAPFQTVCLGTGLGFEVPEGFVGMFVPRSSISKKGLVIQTSLTDCGYIGETHLIVTNCSLNHYSFKKGDRLCSFLCYKYLNEKIEEVEEFQKTERGSNGLGSSGK